MIATRVGDVRRVVAAAPRYLAGRPPVRTPSGLPAHNCIIRNEFGQGDVWTFPPRPGTKAHRNIRVESRLSVNSFESTIRSAADAHGIIRVLSYQIEEEVQDGRLKIILRDAESAALPLHLLGPASRFALMKVRAFVEFSAPRLRANLQRAKCV